MNRIIRGDAVVADDWRTLADDAQPAAGAKVIVPLQRWREQRATLLAAAAAVGVRIPNTEDVDTLWPEIAGRPLLALEWPKYGDGRAHSQAQILRRRFGFKGELRAVGEIGRDLVFHLRRCGFDVIVPRAGENLAGCLQALQDFSTAYQPAADGIAAVFARRRRAV
ncbi:MAG: DUF934 domain-containing protein [Gammaproteobacteria bacterium]|nr:DUF934 domain-containing protein [Gammaproteobacteria bacterium]